MRISDWSSDVCSSDLIARHIVMAGIAMNHAHANLGAFLRTGRNNGCKALSRFHRAGKPRLSARYDSGERRWDGDGVSVQTKHERHREPYRCTNKAQTGGDGQGSEKRRTEDRRGGKKGG